MADLKLDQVHKRFGTMDVIHDIDLEIKHGEFIVFVGPSGCGKSTLLRMIAGLEDITSGTLEIGGKVVNGMPAPQRGIAMVFQSYALYPHMSVRENMSFGLEVSGTPKPLIKERVDAAAEILQLGEYLDRAPKALSGGQRQRVAIGRAIVREPEVFLFDEPLSNLDAALRGQTRVEIARLHAKLGTTMIYVTHDQTEAMTLADRIVVLNAGRIEQVGSPLELYRSPANAFVAGFIGGQTMNFMNVTDAAKLLQGAGDVALPDQAVTIGIRPEHVSRAPDGAPGLTGVIDVIEEFGEFSLCHLQLDDAAPDAPLLIYKSDTPGMGQQGDRITVQADPTMLHAFDSNGRACHSAT